MVTTWRIQCGSCETLVEIPVDEIRLMLEHYEEAELLCDPCAAREKEAGATVLEERPCSSVRRRSGPGVCAPAGGRSRRRTGCGSRIDGNTPARFSGGGRTSSGPAGRTSRSGAALEPLSRRRLRPRSGVSWGFDDRPPCGLGDPCPETPEMGRGPLVG